MACALIKSNNKNFTKSIIFNINKMLKLVSIWAFVLLYFQSACLCDNMDEKMNLMEGDIMGIAPSLLKSDMGSTNQAHWPTNTVPYEFEEGYPENLKRMFRRAAIHIADHTCINFVPRTDETDYVRVIQDRGCYSYVGRIGGAQKMSLPSACERFGTFVHEMLHAVGYQHEQARYDRDKYVQILWENIKPENRHNFEKHPMRIDTRYDYYSVMHYSGDAFSKNGKATIVPKWRGAFIGQRDGMSRGDANEVNKKFCR